MKKILIAGESWMSFTTHVKGFDTFQTSVYEEGIEQLREAIEKGGYDVDFLPNHLASTKFPYHIEELKQYSAVILSDIGANTLLLAPETFNFSIRKPNRCQLLKDYVLQGGALIMIGGYMTFSGIDGKGKWGSTPVQDVLPVNILNYDDRCEHPEGVKPQIVNEHEGILGLPKEWPFLLGYNKTIIKPDAYLAVTINNDPLIAFGSYGKGKSAVFTSDCAPHWAPPEFTGWSYYNKLWQSMLCWLTK